ncbi:MAG TPA: hypothetical protein VN820_06000 [Acidimicrobiales bacterium]|nr:hypothetical protein [Acidimicrobiales bacterium]
MIGRTASDSTRSTRTGEAGRRPVPIPFDLEAEELAAAFAIANEPSAAAAASVLAGADFYDRQYGRWFETGIQLAGVRHERRRVALVAEAVGVAEEALQRFVDNRPAAWDRSAFFARRVRDTARRRRVMTLAAEVYNRVAEGPADELRVLISDILDELEALAIGLPADPSPANATVGLAQ